jgi:hypothetical protein
LLDAAYQKFTIGAPKRFISSLNLEKQTMRKLSWDIFIWVSVFCVSEKQSIKTHKKSL